MDLFGNNIFADNPAACDNIAKPIKCTTSSVRFLTTKEFYSGVDENNNDHRKIRPDDAKNRDCDIQCISSDPVTPDDTNNISSVIQSPSECDSFHLNKMKERTKWIPECLDTIEIMKSIKASSTRELQECLQELENLLVNSQRNFTTALVRSKRSILEILPSLKKSDPDREMKQMQIDKFQKTVSLVVSTANGVANDQIQYLRFLHRFTTYLMRKADQKLFLHCETIIQVMNQSIASLASDIVTRRTVELQCVMEEFSTYFGENITHAVLSAACIMKEDSDRFLFDVNDSSADLMKAVRVEFENQDSLRQRNHEKIHETILRLKNKYKELGKRNLPLKEDEEYARKVEDLDLNLKKAGVSIDPVGEKCNDVSSETKNVRLDGCFTHTLPNDPTKKTTLQSLLRQWTRDLTSLLNSLTSAHDIVLHNFQVYSAEAWSKYQLFIKDYRREFIQDLKYEYKEILNHLLRHVKELSSKKHGFPSPLDILDMEHRDYPLIQERVIDTYIFRIKNLHSKTISFIIHFTDKFGGTVDKCLKLQYKLLKHNNNSRVNMNDFRYQNALLLITLLKSFHRYLQKQITGVTSLFLEVSGRLHLHMVSDFQTLVGNFELECVIQANAFTLALHGIAEKYDDFVKRCWDVSKDMGHRDTSNLKGTLKEVNETLQDFEITQPILMCKKEGEKIFEQESSIAIDGFLSRRFSTVHASSTPISILKVPGLLRSILKRNNENPDNLDESKSRDLNNNIKETGQQVEASVVWIGKKKSKCKVRFEELEDGDGQDEEEEDTKLDPKTTLKGATSTHHQWNCGEEVDNDINTKQIVQEY